MSVPHPGLGARFGFLLLLTAFASGCGGGGGSACTTCPSGGETGALRIAIDFDTGASSALQPAGFRPQDVRRVDVSIVGLDDAASLSLPAPIDVAFVSLKPGVYGIDATAYGDADLVLFSTETTVQVAAADTASLTLDLDAARGDVQLQVNGQGGSGRVRARAATDVPLSVTVFNSDGRPVPNSRIEVTTAPAGFADLELENGGLTDAAGRLTGTLRVPHSGELRLSLAVDGETVSAGTDLVLDFATAVNSTTSELSQPPQRLLVANGMDFQEYTMVVRNVDGEVLPDVPIQLSSNRNTGLDSNVDALLPLPGFESGVTNAQGEFRFQVRSFTSSFMRLDAAGRLFSPPQAGFVDSTIEVFADGVLIGRRTLTFNSTVDPRQGGLNIAPQFVPANGQSSALITVTAMRSTGQPVVNAYVELVNTLGVNQNFLLNIVPEPGFDGFRMNDQGIWRGRIRSTQRGAIFLDAKVDGRTITNSLRSVVFQ